MTMSRIPIAPVHIVKINNKKANFGQYPKERLWLHVDCFPREINAARAIKTVGAIREIKAAVIITDEEKHRQ